MSQLSAMIQSNSSQNFPNDLTGFIDISKGKIIVLLKTVFSFINDNSLLKKESSSSFEKYTIQNKLIQTMQKVFHFYTANYPENGKMALHELIKERYSKLEKYYEQNINYFSSSNEFKFRYYEVEGLILLWLLHTQYSNEYYDELIRLINNVIRLDEDNFVDEKEKYLNKFLKLIIKFPFIKQLKEIIIKVLEVNECNEQVINFFCSNFNSYIQRENTIFKAEFLDKESPVDIGRKSIKSNIQDSPNFSLFQEKSSIKSLNNKNSQKGLLMSINSSGFYTPEFKHNKRNSIKQYRRFTINNINNPKTNISMKSGTYYRYNSIRETMNNLLLKCEKGQKKDSIINSIKNNNNNIKGPVSTKSKLRIAIQGHFYTDDDYKNNIEIEKLNNCSNNSCSKSPTNNNSNNDDNNNDFINNNDNNYENETLDDENEIENKIVSVDELPINPTLSVMSNSTCKNIGIEPQNIIQESKEEEEIDEFDQNNLKNKNNNNDCFKILTDKEVKDFFTQQFTDNKKKKNEFNDKNDNRNIRDKKNNLNNNKNKKRNISNNNKNNISNSANSSNNLAEIKNQKFEKIGNIHQRQISKKQNNINSKRQNNSKMNKNISIQEKMKNYSNQNVYGLLKNLKHNNRSEIGMKNKNENIILQPCTKGKESMENNYLNNHNDNINNKSREKKLTDSVARKNLYVLYNQMKLKK